jgi:hypothetical protein
VKSDLFDSVILKRERKKSNSVWSTERRLVLPLKDTGCTEERTDLMAIG